ncbi:hypothetical protein [uncultured Caulobacter sp.]|uniref:hypothetical protein n=1 Tax=uncultured Caulobacter sp. TaxID=158749 RepID=UPI002624FCB7|nr:hypothetical protein [uncultured Caulobacter sp.]
MLVPSLAFASTPGIVKGRRGGPDMIEGRPPKLDFGKGLVIPMNNAIFKALWEGEDRWVTYGHAISDQRMLAMGHAEDAALGTMKFMLLTLAFAPERLERFESCGWKLKSGNLDDLVRGEIALPGHPVLPAVDEVGDPAGGATPDGESTGPSGYHAVTGYMVMKKDAPLDYVKQKARFVTGTAPSKS